eukprot:2178614-Pyramimonas_sp.AAC.1
MPGPPSSAAGVSWARAGPLSVQLPGLRTRNRYLAWVERRMIMLVMMMLVMMMRMLMLMLMVMRAMLMTTV